MAGDRRSSLYYLHVKPGDPVDPLIAHFKQTEEKAFAGWSQGQEDDDRIRKLQRTAAQPDWMSDT